MINAKQFSGDKILRHSDRIKEFFETGHSRPITAEFDMTNLCNNNCPYCFGYFKREDNKMHMPKEDAFRILDQLKEAGILAVTFTGGGEPLMNRSTIEVMEYSKKKGFDVALITNGLALNEEIAERALKICTWIRMSVDADSPETYYHTHGVDEKAWARMLTNVKKLVELKKESKSACTLGVGYLISKDTRDRDKMLRFVRLFKEIGVDYSQFRPLMQRWHENKDSEAEKESLEFISECLNESTRVYDVLYSTPKYELMKKPKKEWRPYGICLGVNFTIVISADKKVYVCCHQRGIGKYALGDLSKESFKEIWKKRQKTFDKIEFKDCPYFCRNNPFNIILWEIKKGKRKIEKIKEKRDHENFL
jgi:radical SAM protein with 4Fe4S-binding SPASM domain